MEDVHKMVESFNFFPQVRLTVVQKKFFTSTNVSWLFHMWIKVGETKEHKDRPDDKESIQ